MHFNGKVYSENVKYALTYSIDSKIYTGFIEQGGFISGDWNFKYNMIPEEYMASKEKVMEYLRGLGYDKLLIFFHVDLLDNPK